MIEAGRLKVCEWVHGGTGRWAQYYAPSWLARVGMLVCISCFLVKQKSKV